MPTFDISGPAPPDPASSLGRTLLGRFRVEKILGHGGMGEVLLAHDTLLNRRVALKRMRPLNAEGTESAGRRNTILKEARRASQVTDRRIAAIYDVLEVDDEVLIVMEYVDGATLRERMSRPLPVGEFWNLATECVGAVGAAHAHGVIHRDIKPENLMLTRDGQIKILDFGIARRAETQEGTAPSVSVTATTTVERRAEIAGTPQYMAPEAHYGGLIDQRTDIFSLGTVFYELLTARSPFAGPTYEAILQRVMNSTPEPASAVNPTVRPELSVVIGRMMAKDPAQRYESCEAVSRDLIEARKVADAAPPLDARATGSRTRHAILRAAVSAAAVVAALASSWALLRGAFAPSVPTERNLAVLAPVTPGASEDFSSFALGAIEMLGARLQKHQDRAGFQLASFQEGLDEKLTSATEARKVQGVNLALRTTLEQRTDAFSARLELWDAARNRIIASRRVETPISMPFAFLDRIYDDTVLMLRLPARGAGTASQVGIRGAGTLRYLLEGIGRMRTAATAEQARRAADEIELACRTEPGAAIPSVWLASAQRQVYTLDHDPAWLERVEASARDAVARDSTRAECHYALGLALQLKGDKQGALPALRRACELRPTHDLSVLRLARTYAELGRPEEERETYRAAIAARPHCWQPHWWLATWEFRQGHIDESIRSYREMIRRAPDLYKGYSSLGGLLVLRGDYDAAIDTLKRSIALRPDRVAFDNLGTAYFNSGRLEQAIDAYNQSFQFGFADYSSWWNLGDAYYWLRGRRDQAAAAYAQAVRLARTEIAERARARRTFDVMIPANLSTVFPKLGQPDSARTYLDTALRADSTNAMVQYCAALTCWQLGDRSRAIVWLEKSVRGGYPVAWLRDSPIFVEWRGEAAFRAIIAGAGPETQRSHSAGRGGRT